MTLTRLCRPLLFAAVLTSISPAQAPKGYTEGTPIQLQGGYTFSIEELARLDNPTYAGFIVPKRTEEQELGRENLPLAKEALPGNRYPMDEGPASGPLAPQTLGRSFVGEPATQYTPPDSFGSIGPTQVCTFVNGMINWRDKDGNLGPRITSQAFFSSVGGGSDAIDPRATYDPLSQKWYIVAITFNAPNRICLAVSNGPTITNQSNFTFWYYQVPGAFSDYESCGVDRYGVIVGENTFNTSLSAFLGTAVTVIPKANLVGSGLVTGFRFTTGGTSGTAPFSPRGVDNPDPNAPESYIIGPNQGATGQLVMRKLSWSNNVPSISGNIVINVPATSVPGNIPSNGGSQPSLGDRIFHAQIRLNRKTNTWTLTCAHATNCDQNGNANGGVGATRVGMRWYELVNLTNATPTLRQAGTLFDPASSGFQYYWMGSCAMTGQGHLAIGANSANSSTFIRAIHAGRLFGAPLGQTGAPETYFQSTAGYNAGRWGDYSGTFVDPADDQTVWTIQETVASAGVWSTRWAELKAPAPCPIVSLAPNSVAQGQTTNITVTGDGSNGREYYDNDASFPQRLEALFSGTGVTVNSITFNHSNPTQVVLNVTVAANAATGTRNLTLTNPDRQTATGNAVLTVTGGSNVEVAPGSFTVRLGRLASGNVQSLAGRDGDSLVVCKFIVPNQFVEPINVEIDGTAPGSNPTSLSFTVLSRMDTTGSFSQILDMYNWQTNSFDATDVRTDAVGTTFTERTLNGTGSLGRYVGGGNALRARYRIKQTGPAGASIWCQLTDRAVWTVGQ
ncbi:MAG: hypothetical protein KIT11_04700 [Fimbriimonadaceae bacterium]|nr:hypothetical protein [Fimbriimonadaceae bacterium]QYK56808.1 MAG: hypothetical protein KF733_04825 [Fimbriimonadaceae bacterium]